MQVSGFTIIRNAIKYDYDAGGNMTQRYIQVINMRLAQKPQVQDSTLQFTIYPNPAKDQIIIEGALLAPVKKKLFLPGVDVFESSSKAVTSSFDPFAINEALLAKDKKSLWVLVNRARLLGVPAEETIGIVWWQLKSLRLVALSPSAEAAGMKSYPYDKAKRALRNFPAGDIERISRHLLQVYHDGHSGVKDIEIGLEEWALQI